nr:hypothetical protein [Tanacetum cinerariifolium]
MYGESMERFPKSTNAQAEAFEQTMCTKEEKVEYGVEKEKEIKVIVRYLTNPFLDSLEKLGSGRIKIWEGSPFYDLLKMKHDVQDNDKIKRLASLFNIKDRSLEIGEKPPTEIKRIFSNSKKVKFDVDNKNVIELLTHSVDEDTVKRAYAPICLAGHNLCTSKGMQRDGEREISRRMHDFSLYVTRKMSGTIPKWQGLKGTNEQRGTTREKLFMTIPLMKLQEPWWVAREGSSQKSAKQSIFATFSAEAEYIAAFDASKEVVWVRNFISTLANESRITKGARHFHAKVHYLREVIKYDDVKLEKVHTDDNLADPFTKALVFPKHSEHTKNIGMLPASSLM